MKVYVVTSGSYSDFGIRKIFSSEEKAKQYIKLAIEYGDYEINEDVDVYELDPEITLPVSKFKYFYHVEMYKDGNVEGIRQIRQDIIKHPHDAINTDFESKYFYWYNDIWKPDSKYEEEREYKKENVLLCANINANSEEHAIKIVNEKRTQILINNKWPDVEDIKKSRYGSITV